MVVVVVVVAGCGALCAIMIMIKLLLESSSAPLAPSRMHQREGVEAVVPGRLISAAYLPAYRCRQLCT